MLRLSFAKLINYKPTQPQPNPTQYPQPNHFFLNISVYVLLYCNKHIVIVQTRRNDVGHNHIQWCTGTIQQPLVGAYGTTHQDEAAQNMQGASNESETTHVPLGPAALFERHPRLNCGSLHEAAGHYQR